MSLSKNNAAGTAITAAKVGSAPARSLGDNIGSDQWLEAKRKRDEVKKYSQ